MLPGSQGKADAAWVFMNIEGVVAALRGKAHSRHSDLVRLIAMSPL